MAFFGGILWLLLPDASRVGRAVALGLAALLLAWGGAAYFSVDPFESGLKWLQLLASALCFLAAREAARAEQGMRIAANVLVASATVLAMMHFAFHFLGQHSDAAVIGAFYQADVAAGYFVMVCPLALSLAVGARTAESRVAYVAATLCVGCALILSYSRGGSLAFWAVTGLSVPAWMMLGKISWPRAMVFPIVICVVIVALSGVLTSAGRRLVPATAVARTAKLGSKDSSVQARLMFWRGAVQMAAARPLLGWGPSCFGRVLPRYQDDVRFYSRYPHNEYLTFAAEGGLLSLAAFLAFLVGLGMVAWRGLRDTAGDDVCVVLGVVGSLLAALVHLVIDVDWEFAVLQMTWFALAGLLVARVQPAEPLDLPPLLRLSAAFPLLGLLLCAPIPYRASLLVQEADVFRAKRDQAAAVAALEAAAALTPADSTVTRALAETLMDSGDPALAPGALAAARAAVASDPERAVNHKTLAHALQVSQDLPGAMRAIQDALRRDAVNFPDFYNMQAAFHDQLGHPPEVGERLLRVPAQAYPAHTFADMWFFRRDALHPQLQRTFARLGELAQRRGNLQEARDWMERAVAMDPENIRSRFELGMVLMALGQPGDALVQYREIFARKPDQPISRWLLGLAYREVGEEARARALLDEALRQSPDLARVGQPGAPPLRIPDDFFANRAARGGHGDPISEKP